MNIHKPVGAVLAAALAATLLFGGSGAASASDTSPTSEARTAGAAVTTPPFDMDSLIQRADPYVAFVNGAYVLDVQGASIVLSTKEIELATAMISATNSAVTSESLGDGSSARAAGVTKIVTDWFGYRVFLAKGVINNIGMGVTLAGVWVPVFIVAGALATLGVLAGAAKNGVAFNWSPVSVPGYPYGVVWGSEWQ